MKSIRRKCLSPNCTAMASPSQTGYCSYHDSQRTPIGKRAGHDPSPDALLAAKPISELVQ